MQMYNMPIHADSNATHVCAKIPETLLLCLLPSCEKALFREDGEVALNPAGHQVFEQEAEDLCKAKAD